MTQSFLMILDGEAHRIGSADELDSVLADAGRRASCELWVSTGSFPAMCLLASGGDGWLMYLPEAGDAGCSSRGDSARRGKAEFRLANGQVDEYPLAWCLPLTRCHEAMRRFFFEQGRRPEGIVWQED